MDGERFDRVVKAFNEVRVPRRGVFGVLAGMGALFTAYRLMFAQPYCIPQGGSCTLFIRCCEGLICYVGYNNPNVGQCVTGTTVKGAWFAFPGMLTPMATGTVRPTRRAGRDKRNNRRNRRNKATKTPQPTKTPIPTETPIPTASPTLTPTPLPSDLGIEVQLTLDCAAIPETTEIKNMGQSEFTADLFAVPGSGQTALVLGVALGNGESYTVKTFSISGNSSSEYFPEPSDSRYADVTIQFGTRIAVYRGYCDGAATQLLDPNPS